MSKTKIIVIACIAVLLLILVAWYPVEREIALKSFQGYIEKQGVDPKLIDSKNVLWDYKNGGILIVVTYKDDPGIEYYYSYHLWTNRAGEGLKWNVMKLKISDEIYQLGPPYEGKCKYPPIT